jgi:putative redox protein
MTERVIVIQNNKFEIEFQTTNPQDSDSDEFQSVMHINELTPYTMLLSSVGACTAIVLHTYAQNHGVDLHEVVLQLQYERSFQDDQQDANSTGSFVEMIKETLMLRGDLNDQDRQKLFKVSQQCSIHKMLESGIEINSQLIDEGDEE